MFAQTMYFKQRGKKKITRAQIPSLNFLGNKKMSLIPYVIYNI